MPRLSQVLSPRGGEFFDLFEEAGANIVRGAGMLDEMLRDYPAQREIAREILICEQEGDRITHDLIHALNNTFVTPIDREDIISLASALDDIIDFVEEVADMLGLYKIERVTDAAQRMAAVLNQSARQVAEAVQRLRNFSGVSHFTVELNRLENEGDRIAREAVAALFDDPGLEPRDIIRWKDIYERLEQAIDATEAVAHIIEGISIKNG